jgi:hypothetical protein
MTKTAREPEGSRPLALLTDLYRDNVASPTAVDLGRGLDTLLAGVAVPRRRRLGLAGWSGLVAAATASALIAFHVVRRHEPVATRTLTYRIDGGSVIEGGYLREAGQAGLRVAFSEGSRLALTPGTRGRIRSVDNQGAHLAIERGTASVEVTHGTGRRWLVDVGPFVVTVKGTVFTVSWDPLGEQFELGLRRGQVVVSGPVSTGEIALRAGQRLVVNLAKAQTVISEDLSEPLGGGSGGSSPPPVASPPERPSPVENPPAGGPAAARAGKLDHRWNEQVARGQWDRILADAERIGLQTTLGKASSDDLFALADAARYRRRPDLARAALLAERRRFPASPRDPDTLYLLGRVEESRDSGAGAAIAWYDEYLGRAPAGPFAGEALGRKMTLMDKLAGPARARPIAEDYLRRFPKGHYAGSARELMSAP